MTFFDNCASMSRRYARHCAMVPSLLFLFWLTIRPAESRWSESDVLLSWGTVAMLAAGCLLWLARRVSGGKRVRGGAFRTLDLLAGTCFTYYVLHTWAADGFPCAVQFLGTAETAVLYVALRVLLSLEPVSPRWIMGGILACALYECALGMSQLVSGTGRHSLYMLTGTFRNPGPFSAYLLVGAVTGMSWMRASEDARVRNVLLILTSPMLVLLPATWSRAALVPLCLAALWLYRDAYRRWRWGVWAAFLSACVASYFVKQGSADGRMLTWLAALTSWLGNPLWGTGTGSFLHSTAEGIAAMYVGGTDPSAFQSAGVAEYAFNDILKVLVEQGLAGASVCIATAVCAVWQLGRSCVPLCHAMLSLLAFSAFSYPCELLPYRVLAVTAVAWAASAQGEGECRVSPCRWAVVALLASVPALLLAGEAERRLAADRDCRMYAGRTHAAFVGDCYRLLPLERDNARFLFDFGRTLRGQGRYNDSNDMLRQGTLVSADPMFHVLMGNNYRDMGHPEMAAEAYGRAFSTMPNRIYPLYRLMRLYMDVGDSAKAVEYAGRVVSFSVKVESPATMQIKEEAAELLDTLAERQGREMGNCVECSAR